MKKIIIILLLLISLVGILFIIFFNLKEDENNIFKEDGIVYDREDYEYLEEYSDAFARDIVEDYFLFPVEKTISFGVNKDAEEQVGMYQKLAKDKSEILMMEYRDNDNKTREVYSKALELNYENISYVLQHYTNYFDNLDLALTEYQFKFTIDKFKKDDYKKDTVSGTILVSDDTIFVILSDESVDPFLVDFNALNKTNSTFLQYLEENQDILEKIVSKASIITEQTKQSTQNMPEDVKKFALDMWSAYINLDTTGLQEYYADKIWFYAGEEWFEEWEIPYEEERLHNFIEIESDSVFEGYQELKAEDFEEDFPEMQEIVKSIDDIELYKAKDLINICYTENSNDFFDFFRINQEDIIMIVRLDDGNTCTVDGNFFGDEIRFWVIRNIEGGYKVVTDYTE